MVKRLIPLFSLIFIAAIFSVTPSFAKCEAPEVKINIFIENEEYNERVCVDVNKFTHVSRYGSFEAFALAQYENGIKKEDIFNYVSEGLGDRFFALLREKETPPENATYEVREYYPHFIYKEGKTGKTFGERESVVALAKAMDGEKTSLTLRPEKPAIGVKELKEKTRSIGVFSTSFETSSASRKHNVKLAASKINGVKLEPYERFSFNTVVGKRTEENGFKNAKVIRDGAYVDGVGGGVCQVATTLYNAAIRAGMRINRVSRHTFAPSYVRPSADAMVSDATDFEFTNGKEKTYIFAKCVNDTLTVVFYGEKSENINIVYEIVEEIPCPIVDENGKTLDDTEGYSLLKKGAAGYKSRAYAVDEKGVKTLIRADEYRAYPEIYAKKR